MKMGQVKTSDSSGNHVSHAGKENAALEEMIAKITEVSTLPHIALKLIRICQNPNTDPRELCDVLSSDPVMTGKVMSCVNSSAYGLTHPVTSLHRAVCLLGYAQLRDLAMTASVASVFKHNETCGSYVRANLWRHMVAVAICSRMIAARCELPEFEEVYLAGLLHDIGIILIDQYEHTAFSNMMHDFPQHAGVNLALVEQGRLGYDHTMLGERVAMLWGLSEELGDTIRHHHQVTRYEGKSPRMIACVDLANLICTLRGWSSIGHKLIAANQWSLDQLKLTTLDVQIINDDLHAEVRLYRELIRAGMPRSS
ncbi:MAG TPA: hypothetical protein DCM28_01835 [Phycisphaerales bacterium]|nr:hypothetical protein [Phycisphaerales bacterium]HCD33096.1 hypothetical protein [Phycisphaerales bacterium]|tara:strand:- start:1598 stop:2530 length:933 start_codon:yes stop_codon:yes gene_type:complete